MQTTQLDKDNEINPLDSLQDKKKGTGVSSKDAPANYSFAVASKVFDRVQEQESVYRERNGANEKADTARGLIEEAARRGTSAKDLASNTTASEISARAATKNADSRFGSKSLEIQGATPLLRESQVELSRLSDATEFLSAANFEIAASQNAVAQALFRAFNTSTIDANEALSSLSIGDASISKNNDGTFSVKFNAQFNSRGHQYAFRDAELTFSQKNDKEEIFGFSA